MKRNLLLSLLSICVLLILSLTVTTLIGKTASENSKINKGANLVSDSAQKVTLILTTIGKSETKEYDFDFQKRETAIDLLKQNHKIKSKSVIAKTTDIYCIDDVCASGGYFWAFYVNNMPGFDPGRHLVKRGDKLEFALKTS